MNPAWRWRRDSNPCTRLCRPLPRLSATPPCEASCRCPLRADDGIRTRDPHLGKVMRYQLRYVRISLWESQTLADTPTLVTPGLGEKSLLTAG